MPGRSGWQDNVHGLQGAFIEAAKEAGIYITQQRL
jgi:hypothetical protein